MGVKEIAQIMQKTETSFVQAYSWGINKLLLCNT